ncbi:hypothetical protein [Pseudomonas putida]|uniref:Uncharacterized protein n=1 Tax=Pseudomonas putida TaxID=303 RepID=A0A8I1EBL4_PSEPU|nr:hypothetical protein [Pseudomonas putida]MBI6883032.1 hypothetical protein [Pseudomonas putida]
MSRTIKCKVPIQAGFVKECTAEFDVSGRLLMVDGMELGEEPPTEFTVELEDHQIAVRFEPGACDHFVIEDDRDAFVAMVLG